MTNDNGQFNVTMDKLKTLMEVLVNHSRTEWGGMDAEGLLMVIDQETHPRANEDLYTLDEVAEIMSMSVLTIRQYVRMGKLRAIKEWRNWMIPSNEIARLMYEKKNGVELQQSESVFVIMDASIEDEENYYSSIYKYKFLKIDDVLSISGIEYSAHAVREYEKLFEPAPIDSIWIEVVSNIPDFFRKTGDAPFRKEKTDGKINLNTDVQVAPIIIDKLLADTESLLYSDDVDKDIKSMFGSPSDINTVYKIYKTVLNLSAKVNRIQDDIERRT